MTVSPTGHSGYLRPAVVGLILLAATMVSFTLGSEHGAGVASIVGVLGLAAFKIRLVGLEFMELRSAPTPLRAAFETYCVLIWLVLCAVYLVR